MLVVAVGNGTAGRVVTATMGWASVVFSQDGAWGMGMGNGSAAFSKDGSHDGGVLAASEAPGGATNVVLKAPSNEQASMVADMGWG